MGIDWHRVVAVPVFGALIAAAYATGEARVIVGTLGALAWPFVFIWFGDDLAVTPGLHWGLVDRPSRPSLVRWGGWVILAIDVLGIGYLLWRY